MCEASPHWMPYCCYQDETELPNDMKRPFGKHGEGTIFEREGIFDWDYKVGAFRTGLERDQGPQETAKHWPCLKGMLMINQ